MFADVPSRIDHDMHHIQILSFLRKLDRLFLSTLFTKTLLSSFCFNVTWSISLRVHQTYQTYHSQHIDTFRYLDPQLSQIVLNSFLWQFGPPTLANGSRLLRARYQGVPAQNLRLPNRSGYES